ncbi:MAG: rhomboid family intramembrane serine protease [Candidatus Heimdallarchaeota archaeon]|nr:rhomboid family intramembrane serine protease [Candidatus Heimdallarchaeota archaeon]
MLQNRLNDIQKRLPPLFTTLSLTTSIIVIYVICVLLFPDQLLLQSPEAMKYLGQINDRIFAGEIYRLFTAMFLHANVVHLASNVLFLLIFASRLEEIQRGIKVFVVFIGSGFIGNLATLAIVFLGVNFNSLGASGAIFGLLGALLYLLQGKSKHERRKMYYFIAIFLIITIGQDTNVISHFAGFLGGYFLMKVIDS